MLTHPGEGNAGLTARRSFALALAVALLLGLAPVFSHSLWTPDEPTGAGIGRAMADSGDWIVPRLNGKPFLEKPPLYWWTLAASLRLLGASDVAARVLWLDAFTANVDRSWRNPNLLVWGDELWVIDHVAALYFHHAWPGGLTDPARFAAQAWDPADHVLRQRAGWLPGPRRRAG